MIKCLLILILLPSACFAQIKTNFKDGLYTSYNHLIKGEPYGNITFSITRYIPKDTIELLGTRYKIEFPLTKIKKKFIRDSVYCIVKDSEVYLNNQLADSRVEGFKKVLCESENYFRFISSYMDQDKQTSIAAGWFIGGAIGGAITGSTVKGQDGLLSREPALINKSDGKIYELDAKGVTYLFFNDHKDLFNEYKTVKDKGDIMAVWRLIDRYEERIKAQKQ
ncbi:MAG: hypothetical protein IPJ79_17315 [Bacteroidetes bacterium]|nr:hypothetical protein [Bacteroidota bacterium]